MTQTFLSRLVLILSSLRKILHSRNELLFENLALRQQLAVLKKDNTRPRLCGFDRVFWVWLRRFWPKRSDSLIIVKPETVVRWNRDGFRRYWRRKSSRRKPGRPRIAHEIRELIRRMARENSTGRAPRIPGELLKLGFEVAESTVSY